MPEVTPDSTQTCALLDAVGRGDRLALDRLLTRSRPDLREIVEYHLDPRLRPLLDPPDVVQEIQLEVVRRMDDYLRRRPMPFHLWVRKTAYERLLNLRRDIQRDRRSMDREVPLSERSSLLMIRPLLHSSTSPSRQAVAREFADRIGRAVAELSDQDREILTMRHAEELSYEEIGCLLEIDPDAVRTWYGRALIRLQSILSAHGLLAIDPAAARKRKGDRPNVEEDAARHSEAADLLRKELTASEVVRLSLPGSASPRGDELSGVLGDFCIVREVGKGSTGVVYEAEQISWRRRVALKVLPFAAMMDPRQLQRFHNEAQAAAGLHHTNIVPVFSVGCERGVHFYAMQFIDGQPLSEIIRQLREREKKSSATGREHTASYQPSTGKAVSTLPLAEMTPLTGEDRRSRGYFRKVAELGIQAAEALDYAHQMGIVHRDVRPANLLRDSRGNVWVTDFGLAPVQHSEASLTWTGQRVGTPRYLSPEQALAKRVLIDHRTDIYSLGATLYELLTLRPAFASEEREEIVKQIACVEPARPRRLERVIPPELEMIVVKAMAKRPQDRYDTAKELADDLRRFLEQKPIQAQWPAIWVRVAKWLRRYKTAAWTAPVVLL